jgi:hypothetical protein
LVFYNVLNFKIIFKYLIFVLKTHFRIKDYRFNKKNITSIIIELIYLALFFYLLHVLQPRFFKS